ncbi:MAG: ABC transporter permease subunit [Thermoplasmata archaeon]
MRFEKAWTVAAKEMAEFRSNKYVLLTLLLLPLTMAVVIPLVLVLPIVSSAPSGEPLPLDPPVDMRIQGEALVDRVLVNASISDSEISSSIIRDSRVVNSTLEGVTVTGSILEGVTLKNSAVRGSNVIDPGEISGSSLVNSPIIGAENEAVNIILLVLDTFLMFFIIIPAAIPALMASYSLVGEKLNKSLEPLLATPTTDGELLFGKALSIFLPTMGATWLSGVIFIVLINITLEPSLGFAPLPTPTWILALVLLAPLFAVLSITANVIISSRVSDVRASQQLGALVVLPAIFLFMLPLFGVVILGPLSLLAFAGGLIAIIVAMAILALRLFRREEILVSWK